MAKTKKTKKPVRPPHSEAENSYDMLTDVRRAVRDEPKRLHMGYLLIKGKKLLNYLAAKRLEQKPACGIVGCIAGWTTVLAGTMPKYSDSSGWAAMRLLIGNTKGQSVASNAPYFDSSERTPLYNDLNRLFYEFDHYRHKPGTVAYAREVSRAIRKVQLEHAKELKAITLDRVGLRKLLKAANA